MSPAFAIAAILFSGSLHAAVTFSVTDTRPGETAVTTPTTTLGTVASSAAVPTATYTITGLDLTSVGGGASETIAFDITYSQTGGTGVQINGFGNISVTGADNNQIDQSNTLNETLTATLSLVSTTFSGGLSNLGIGFTGMTIGGFGETPGGGPGSIEFADIIHDGGTTTLRADVSNSTTFASSLSFTLDPTVGLLSNGTTPENSGAMNLSGFTVEITAVPEPAAILLGAFGMIFLLRRRR